MFVDCPWLHSWNEGKEENITYNQMQTWNLLLCMIYKIRLQTSFAKKLAFADHQANYEIEIKM